jgi:hypothetical protein
MEFLIFVWVDCTRDVLAAAGLGQEGADEGVVAAADGLCCLVHIATEHVEAAVTYVNAADVGALDLTVQIRCNGYGRALFRLGQPPGPLARLA